MPIYEYKCEKCGNKIEELVIGKEPKKCKKCKGKLKRLMSAANFEVNGYSAFNNYSSKESKKK